MFPTGLALLILDLFLGVTCFFGAAKAQPLDGRVQADGGMVVWQALHNLFLFGLRQELEGATSASGKALSCCLLVVQLPHLLVLISDL